VVFLVAIQLLQYCKKQRTITSVQGGLNVETPTALADRKPGLEWDFMRHGIAKGAVSLAIFAALY